MMASTTRLWFLRRFTTHGVNPVTLLFFDRLPGCGTLAHVSRTSGRRYRSRSSGSGAGTTTCSR
jgi:hypothetical protein